MPTSPAGNRTDRVLAFAGSPSRATNAREGGFTLVELMIVVTIIALASAVAVLAMPDPRGRLIDEAERFAARARAAHDLAIIDARPVSVWVTAGGYGFDRRVGGAWTPIADKPLRVERWGKDIAAAPAGPAGRDRITYDPTGFADRPLAVRLTRDDLTATVQLRADGGVRVDG